MIPKTYYVWNPFISSTTLFENQPFCCILRGRLYVICTTIRKMTLNVNSNKFRVEIEREYCILFHTGSTEANCLWQEIEICNRFWNSEIGIFLKLQPVFVNIEDKSLLYSNVFKFSTFTQGGQIFLVNNKVKHTKVIAVCLVLRKQTRQQMSKLEKWETLILDVQFFYPFFQYACSSIYV